MIKTRYTKGRVRLKEGEYLRKNGTFEYRWTENRVRRSVYARSLDELRDKENAVLNGTAIVSKNIKSEKIPVERLCEDTNTSVNATVNSYFEIWKNVKSGIRQTTFDTYLKLYNRYIGPNIGTISLKELSYSKVVMFYKSLIENRGLGISIVSNINIVLSMILNVAVKDGVLQTNPCTGAIKELNRKYSGTVKEVKALTGAEQAAFEEFLSRPGTYHCLCPLFTVMLYTGIRVGELCALRWEDVDFEKNVIHINHTLVYDGTSSSEMTLNPPKTKTSERCIPMNAKVREALLEEKKHQESCGIRCKVRVSGYKDFVFLDGNGDLYHLKKLNHKLDRISIAIDKEIKSKGSVNGLTGFPHVHNHMLRHTFATRMREAGADIKATADIMGHHEVGITLNTYTDASENFKMKEISLLESGGGNLAG